MNRKEYLRLPPLIEEIKKRGFVFFKDGDYDLNIIGVRNLKERESNLFDDEIHVIYRQGDIWVDEWGAATTDPGAYWLQKEDYKPCAIMYHDQQARGIYKIGLHRGKADHEGLLQVKKMKFWRDGNKDSHLDFKGNVYNDLIGLNVHRSSKRPGGSHYVNKWSAGCQVFKRKEDLARLIFLCRKQIKSLGYQSFSYCLIGV